MDEKVKDQDVLLVKEKSSGELKVVTGIEKDGKPKVVEAKPENEPSFLKIDKNGNALDNFMSNFLRQYKDPTHFQFFKAPIDKVKVPVYPSGKRPTANWRWLSTLSVKNLNWNAPTSASSLRTKTNKIYSLREISVVLPMLNTSKVNIPLFLFHWIN